MRHMLQSFLVALIVISSATAVANTPNERRDIKVDRVVSNMGLEIENQSAIRLVYRLLERDYDQSTIENIVKLCRGPDGNINASRLKAVVEHLRKQKLIRETKQKLRDSS